MLQRRPVGRRQLRPFVSDLFDFTIYVDARPADIEKWYVERFLRLQRRGLPRPGVVLPPLRVLDRRRGGRPARSRIWRDINGPNLLRNVLPTRERADLVLRKGDDHAVQEVRLRKL